jgi:hypothetical protein
MVIAPWLVREEDYFLSPRLGFALVFTPVAFGLAFMGFALAGDSGRTERLATWISVTAGLVLLCYWIIPWLIAVL